MSTLTSGAHQGAEAAASRRVLRLPPAFSIAAVALFDAAATSKCAFAFNSPTPRILTPSRGWVTTPALSSASSVTGSAG